MLTKTTNQLLPSIQKLSPFQRNFLIRFLGFFLLFGVFLFPIVHANFHYNDDWFHIGTEVNVMRDGRPLQQLALYFFSNFSIRDVAPLTQIAGTILAAAGAALASIALNYSFLSGILALSFLFCNEFFLENLSYRFESLGMTLAMGLTLAAFYVPIVLQRKSPFIVRGAEITTLTLAFASYQPTVNIYGGLTCLAAIMALLKTESLKNTWKIFTLRMTVFITSLFIYRVTIAVIRPFHEIYAKDHAKIIHSLTELFSNYKEFFYFFRLLVKPWRHHSIYAYNCFLLFLLILGTVSLAYRLFLILQQKKQALLKLTSIVLFLSGIFLFFAGPMLLLAHPVFTPRVMCGIPVILTAATTILLDTPLPKKLYNLAISYCFYLLLGAFSSACAYGNASNSLETYRLALDAQMRDDITYFYYSPIKEQFEKEGFSLSFIMVGNKGRYRPDVVQRIQNQYPIFKEIFIQKSTWFTVFPAMGFDIMRMNLIGGGSLNDDTPAFIWPFWDLNPNAYIFKGFLEDKVHTCEVTDIKKHSVFFTYRIGSYIVFDYDQHCSNPSNRKNFSSFEAALKEQPYQDFQKALLAEERSHFLFFNLFSPQTKVMCLKSNHLNFLNGLKWMGSLEDYYQTEFTPSRLTNPIEFKEGLADCQTDEIIKMMMTSTNPKTP